ncbi:DUF4005 domain-containing protein [Psidium guajava]|nr:DUF4005 domain-containing protein [Psidium guajava]
MGAASCRFVAVRSGRASAHFLFDRVIPLGPHHASRLVIGRAYGAGAAGKGNGIRPILRFPPHPKSWPDHPTVPIHLPGSGHRTLSASLEHSLIGGGPPF